MKNELEQKQILSKCKSENLPAGSLWTDIRAESGHGCGIEWLCLYEDSPVSIMPDSRLLYVKVIIQTSAGREFAENGQSEILSRCNLRSFETATFSRALALAMSLWDAEH